MPTPSPILLILGAGPNIGHPVARLFTSKGYRIALAGRSLKESDSTSTSLHITADFANPADIISVFEKVKASLGIPSVVLYNASSVTFSPPTDPFAISLDAFKTDTTINTTSVFAAAQQAVLGFASLPAEAAYAKMFCVTGNILNVTPLPGFMDQGTGKAASAHMMMAAAAAYGERGYRFYYVDERKADGSAKYRVDGEAHGKIFLELAEGKGQGPWLQTFVKDVGYQSFESQYRG